MRLDIDCCLSIQELDFYTNNFWIFGGTTVILAGFSLAQLTREIPDGTHPALECLDRRLCCEGEDSNRDVHQMCIDVYIIQCSVFINVSPLSHILIDFLVALERLCLVSWSCLAQVYIFGIHYALSVSGSLHRHLDCLGMHLGPRQCLARA